MSNQLLYILVFLLTIACKKQDEEIILSKNIIENQTFNTTLKIEGSEYDGTIIRNCIFENINGDGLQIKDVKNLTIENCTFKNISKNAIRFRNSGSSDKVNIIDNIIFNIEENGILAAENHINTTIKGNHIHHVATNNLSSQFGSPHHGIYFQGANVAIEENIIHDIINNEGNCISIRTYGTIARNKLFHAVDHGISYYSDHPAMQNKLLIENNIIYDNGKRGINLASNGNTANHIGSALIRFNTILSHSKSNIGINDDLIGVTFEIIGNILIRRDSASTYISSIHNYNPSYNITSNGDIGFVNYNARDLHITTSSAAHNAAIGISDFPKFDYDRDIRINSSLDIGADEL